MGGFLHDPHMHTSSRPLRAIVTRHHNHSSMSGYFSYCGDECHLLHHSSIFFVICCHVLVFTSFLSWQCLSVTALHLVCRVVLSMPSGWLPWCNLSFGMDWDPVVLQLQ
ncbi:hypothetical protein L208DRAFT_1406665 [Tricholoma matsutake]|nr:hypothetical protein L208DRAFT_1406665 [Tricholoma matsutake 945]